MTSSCHTLTIYLYQVIDSLLINTYLAAKKVNWHSLLSLCLFCNTHHDLYEEAEKWKDFRKTITERP